MSQPCFKLQNDGIEDSEVDNLEKIHFADLVKDVESVAGLSPLHQFRVGQNDVTKTWPQWLPRQFQNGGLPSFEMNSFRIAGTSEVET